MPAPAAAWQAGSNVPQQTCVLEDGHGSTRFQLQSGTPSEQLRSGVCCRTGRGPGFGPMQRLQGGQELQCTVWMGVGSISSTHGSGTRTELRAPCSLAAHSPRGCSKPQQCSRERCQSAAHHPRSVCMGSASSAVPPREAAAMQPCCSPGQQEGKWLLTWPAGRQAAAQSHPPPTLPEGPWGTWQQQQ